MSRLKSVNSANTQDLSVYPNEEKNNCQHHGSPIQNQRNSDYLLKYWLKRRDQPMNQKEELDISMNRVRKSPKPHSGIRELGDLQNLPKTEGEESCDVITDEKTRMCQLQTTVPRSSFAISLQKQTATEMMNTSLGANALENFSTYYKTTPKSCDLIQAVNLDESKGNKTINYTSEMESSVRDHVPTVHESKPVLLHVASDHRPFPTGTFTEQNGTPKAHRPKVVIAIPRTKPSGRDKHRFSFQNTLPKLHETAQKQSHSKVVTSLQKTHHQTKGSNSNLFTLNQLQQVHDQSQSGYISNYKEESVTKSDYTVMEKDNGVRINIPSRHVLLVMAPKIPMTSVSRDAFNSPEGAHDKKISQVTDTHSTIKEIRNEEYHQQNHDRPPHHQQKQTIESADEVLWSNLCTKSMENDYEKHVHFKYDSQIKFHDEEKCNNSLRSGQPYYILNGNSFKDISQQSPPLLNSNEYEILKNNTQGNKTKEQLIDMGQEVFNAANLQQTDNSSLKLNQTHPKRLTVSSRLHDQKQNVDLSNSYSFRQNIMDDLNVSDSFNDISKISHRRGYDRTVKDPSLVTGHPVSAQLLKYIASRHMNEETRNGVYNNQAEEQNVDSGLSNKSASVPRQCWVTNSSVSSSNDQAFDHSSDSLYNTQENLSYIFQSHSNHGIPDLNNSNDKYQEGFFQRELFRENNNLIFNNKELRPTSKRFNLDIPKENDLLGWIPVRLNNVNFTDHNFSAKPTNQNYSRCAQVTSTNNVVRKTTNPVLQSFPAKTTLTSITQKRNHLIAMPHLLWESSKLVNGDLQRMSLKTNTVPKHTLASHAISPAKEPDCKKMRDFQMIQETNFATPAADLLSSVARAPINYAPNLLDFKQTPSDFIRYSEMSSNSDLNAGSLSSMMNTAVSQGVAMYTSSHSYSRESWAGNYHDYKNNGSILTSASLENCKGTSAASDGPWLSNKGHNTLDFPKPDYFHKVKKDSSLVVNAPHIYTSPLAFQNNHGAISVPAISRLSTENKDNTGIVSCQGESPYKRLFSANMANLTRSFSNIVNPSVYSVPAFAFTTTSSHGLPGKKYSNYRPDRHQECYDKGETFWKNFLLRQTVNTEAGQPPVPQRTTAVTLNNNKISFRNVLTPISTMLSSSLKSTDNNCPICHRAFTRPWLLKGHMRIHTGERPFHCSFPACDKAFADKSNLRSHMQIHTAVSKNFVCYRCGRAFLQKRYLHKHITEVCRTVLPPRSAF